MNESTASKVPSQNWRSRQRLKLALTLGLRRQIFIAICDNLRLKDEIVNELEQELGYGASSEQNMSQGYPKIVTLNINLENPNLLLQIAQWLKQNPLPPTATGNPASAMLPNFQFLGIELLTGQPAEVQQNFLRNLLAVERHLPQLESNLLLWLPRNWLNLIKQSVPEFWRWHTSIFWFSKESPSIPPAMDAFQEKDAHFSDFSGSFTDFSVPYYPKADSSYHPSNLSHYPQGKNGSSLIKVAVGDGEFEEEEEYNNGFNNSSLAQFATEVPLDPQPEIDRVYSLEEIAQLQRSASPAFVSEAYLQLGNYHREQIAEGDKTTKDITTAIEAYTLSLQWLGDRDSRIPEILNDKGNLYWMLSRQPSLMNEASLYLEQAIESYRLALDKMAPEAVPQIYAMVQNNLGAAYNDLSRHQDSAENLQLAIRAYVDALAYRTIERDPHKYASTQNNLGTAYWHLAQQQEPIENLKAAIDAYEEALAQYHPEQDPLNWAMIQNNLGTAYWNLAQYEEPKKFLQLAIDSYKKSLKYRTQDLDPVACAATQNNLGTTYWHLGAKYTQEPTMQQEYFQKAIAAYEIAITIAERLSLINPPIPVNFDLVAARNNLGLVHYQVAIDVQGELEVKVKTKHLEAAMQSHLQALQEAAPETDNYNNTFNYIVNTVRVFYREGGIDGQNKALSQVPGGLLPKILPML